MAPNLKKRKKKTKQNKNKTKQNKKKKKHDIQASVSETSETEISEPSSRTASVHFYKPIKNNVSCLLAFRVFVTTGAK